MGRGSLLTPDTLHGCRAVLVHTCSASASAARAPMPKHRIPGRRRRFCCGVRVLSGRRHVGVCVGPQDERLVTALAIMSLESCSQVFVPQIRELFWNEVAEGAQQLVEGCLEDARCALKYAHKFLSQVAPQCAIFWETAAERACCTQSFRPTLSPRMPDFAPNGSMSQRPKPEGSILDNLGRIRRHRFLCSAGRLERRFPGL